MGASRALGAYLEWQALSPLARLVLIRMCLIAKDDDKRPLYWGGREVLLQAMGRDSPYSPTDYRALSRVIRELTDAGAISRQLRAKPGRNSVYRLNVLAASTRPDLEDDA